MPDLKKSMPPKEHPLNGGIPPKDASPTPHSMPPREAPNNPKPTKTTD